MSYPKPDPNLPLPPILPIAPPTQPSQQPPPPTAAAPIQPGAPVPPAQPLTVATPAPAQPQQAVVTPAPAVIPSGPQPVYTSPRHPVTGAVLTIAEQLVAAVAERARNPPAPNANELKETEELPSTAPFELKFSVTKNELCIPKYEIHAIGMYCVEGHSADGTLVSSSWKRFSEFENLVTLLKLNMSPKVFQTGFDKLPYKWPSWLFRTGTQAFIDKRMVELNAFVGNFSTTPVRSQIRVILNDFAHERSGVVAADTLRAQIVQRRELDERVKLEAKALKLARAQSPPSSPQPTSPPPQSPSTATSSQQPTQPHSQQTPHQNGVAPVQNGYPAPSHPQQNGVPPTQAPAQNGHPAPAPAAAPAAVRPPPQQQVKPGVAAVAAPPAPKAPPQPIASGTSGRVLVCGPISADQRAFLLKSTSLVVDPNGTPAEKAFIQDLTTLGKFVAQQK